MCVPVERRQSEDYKLFLTKRAREFSRIDPDFRDLRRVLLKLGGDELVGSSDQDPMLGLLIDFGIVFAGPVIEKPCHSRMPDRTLGRIWKSRSYGIVGIGVGYGLNQDGLWREHSFGVLREGVLEITSVRQKYFGLLLISEAADGFAEAGIRKGPGSAR